MPVPRTHYQVSFTARQGVFFFVFFLAALAGAYFLGVATGVSGRPGKGGEIAAASTPAPANPTPAPTEKPAREARVSPHAGSTPPAETRTAAPAIAAREPGQGIQFFEDETTPGVTPGATTETRKAATTPAPASSGFWIQVLSSTSEGEAKNRRMALASKGYRAAVSPVHSGHGPTLYRVRVGPYSSREEAAKASETLVRKEKQRTWIVPPGE